MTFVFFATPRLRVTSELLSLCDAMEARLNQAQSASTQILAAVVHHLLHEYSREDAKGKAIRHFLFASVILVGASFALL